MRRAILRDDGPRAGRQALRSMTDCTRNTILRNSEPHAEEQAQ